MPNVNPGESQRDYLTRCIPVLIGEGKPHDQAVAICYSLYDEHKNSPAPQVKSFDPTQYKIKTGQEIKTEIAARHKLEVGKVEIKNIVAKMEELSPYEFVCKITTDSMDREGEVLIPEGCDPSDFLKTGSVFFNHNYDWPVAKALTLNKAADHWESKVAFPKCPDYIKSDYFPDYLRSLVQQDIIKGISVGFMPTESRAPSKLDIERYGKDLRRVFSKWKLLEFSIAPLQCNQDALITAVGKNLVSASYAKMISPTIKIPEAPPVIKTPPPIVIDSPPVEVEFIDLSPKRLTPAEIQGKVKTAFEELVAKSKGIPYLKK